MTNDRTIRIAVSLITQVKERKSSAGSRLSLTANAIPQSANAPAAISEVTSSSESANGRHMGTTNIENGGILFRKAEA